MNWVNQSWQRHAPLPPPHQPHPPVDEVRSYPFFYFMTRPPGGGWRQLLGQPPPVQSRCVQRENVEIQVRLSWQIQGHTYKPYENNYVLPNWNDKCIIYDINPSDDDNSTVSPAVNLTKLTRIIRLDKQSLSITLNSLSRTVICQNRHR